MRHIETLLIMKVAIIGAGNMGGAIARGMAKGSVIAGADIMVSDPSQQKLDVLQAEHPEVKVTTNNRQAIRDARYVILAVKPWLVEEVLGDVMLRKGQTLVSVAAGIDCDTLRSYLPTVDEMGYPTEVAELTIFRIIPNTAISLQQSMTLIASQRAAAADEAFILKLFNEMGVAMFIPEEKMTAATALTSCGIAYVLKYIQAAMQAGIEMGIYPKDAMQMVAQSVKGAAELILPGNTHPSVEIDKVCTPGGITIKGLNELEHEGFTSAIIKAMKAAK